MMLNGCFNAGCHTATCFSTYHNIRAGVCAWCHRTELELVKAGAVWLGVPKPQPACGCDALGPCPAHRPERTR
jgi:hypothetical protein